MSDYIRDENGKVYIRYFQPIPKYVVIGNKREFVCSVRNGVSMLLVDESDVPTFLTIEGGCCGGKRKVFSLPSQEAINVWLTGNR